LFLEILDHCRYLINLTSSYYFFKKQEDNKIINGIELKRLSSFVPKQRSREDVSWKECVGILINLEILQ